MPRVTCRCGEAIDVTSSTPDRVDCPRCGARIRLRRRRNAAAGSPVGVSASADGFIRFHCPCGRRLKVRASDSPEAGKCPDCGRIVPVPEPAWAGEAAMGRSYGDSESRTDEMDQEDLARLAEWGARHGGRSAGPGYDPDATPSAMPAVAAYLPEPASQGDSASSKVKYEAGLRVCPGCGKPVHLSATTCRECGSPVPRR
jgi:hypothetical protein